MKVLLRMFLTMLTVFSVQLVESAAWPQQPAESRRPYFISLIYYPELKDSATDCLRAMVRQGLFDALGISTMPTGEKMPEQAIADVPEIYHYDTQKSALFNLKQNAFLPQSDAQLSNMIHGYQNQGRPLIILCDSTSYAWLAKFTQSVRSRAIHSIIVIDAAVASGINFDAISHRLYNFYGEKDNSYRTWRKIAPSGAGFKLAANSEYASKVVNVKCNDATTQKLFYSYSKGWTGSWPSSYNDNYISTLNLPSIIQMVDNHFSMNWDLICQSFGGRQDLLGASPGDYPLVIINRPLTFSGKKVESKQEKWESEDLSTEATKRLIEISNKEVEHQIRLTTQYPTSEIVRDVLKKTPKEEWQNLILSGEQVSKQVKTSNIMYFFVPTKEDIHLVLFIRTWQQFPPQRESFELLLGGRQAGFPTYFVNLGQVGNNYYAVAKYKFSRVQATGGTFEIRENYQPKIRGNWPNIPAGDFNFIAYADIQKQNQLYPIGDAKSGSAMHHLQEVLQSNEGTNGNNILQLVVGDFVITGSDLEKGWDQILTPLSQVAQQINCPLLATAIGTHDFSHIPDYNWLPSFLGKESETLGGVKVLYFGQYMPTYGHLFHFIEKNDEKLGSSGNELDPNEHVRKTHNWFDIGKVRFIHLPYATEEEYQPVADENEDPSTWELVKKAGSTAKYIATGHFWFNFDVIINEFKEALKAATAARQRGEVKFVIVYGHAPLVTAPQFHHQHDGLFNSLATNTIAGNPKKEFAKQLLQLFVEHDIDAYFSGHNHQYDHCMLNLVTTGGVQKHIPLITVGLGTTLRSVNWSHRGLSEIKPLPEVVKLLGVEGVGLKDWSITSSRFIGLNQNFDDKTTPVREVELAESFVSYPKMEPLPIKDAKFLPAYLKCSVHGGTMRCRLLTEGGKSLDSFDIISKAGLGTTGMQPWMEPEKYMRPEVSAVTQPIAALQARMGQQYRQQLQQGVQSPLAATPSPTAYPSTAPRPAVAPPPTGAMQQQWMMQPTQRPQQAGIGEQIQQMRSYALKYLGQLNAVAFNLPWQDQAKVQDITNEKCLSQNYQTPGETLKELNRVTAEIKTLIMKYPYLIRLD